MKRKLIVAMHGVTGRMGTNQHLIRSIFAIMNQGGIRLSTDELVDVEPILVGRNEGKLRRLAEQVAGEEIGRSVAWSTDLASVLGDNSVDIVFDSASTPSRASVIRQAVENGKAVYCEKPVAVELREAYALADLCESRGIRNGVVQDKLWLPGIAKLRALRDAGFFGSILSVRGEFGYWVFTGHDENHPAQRPSWNYRVEEGGGIVVDMFCHWHYLLNDLFGPIKSVMAHASTDISERVDEHGKPYPCTADDSAYAIFEMESGATCQFNSSFATRVRRDDLLTIQVDGTSGSAVAGLRDCWTQSLAETPTPTWNPDAAQPIDFYKGWKAVSDSTEYDNAFRSQWELFLKHVAGEGEFPWSIRSGAAGVALAQAGLQSSREGRRVELSEIAS